MNLLSLPLRPMLAGDQGTWWQSLLGTKIPSAGVYVARNMLRNLSATTGQTARDRKKHCSTTDAPKFLHPNGIRQRGCPRFSDSTRKHL